MYFVEVIGLVVLVKLCRWKKMAELGLLIWYVMVFEEEVEIFFS